MYTIYRLDHFPFLPFKCNPTPENEHGLFNQRRVVKKIVRQAKVAEKHRVALASHDNPKEFFVYVNKHKPCAHLGPMFSVDGPLLTNNEEMAREFNNYCSNVFTVKDIDNIPDPVIIHAGENTLTDIDCAEPEVEAKLKELKPDKAAGSDIFLLKILKAVADGVVQHLCQIFDHGRGAPRLSVCGHLTYPQKRSPHGHGELQTH